MLKHLLTYSRPIKDWQLLPATISTMFEGGYMEAIRRLCPGISNKDFLSRMPPYIKTPDENGENGKTITITGLGNRQEAFRNAHGLVAWIARGGTRFLREAIEKKLSPMDLINNTTQNFYGLTKSELFDAKFRNKQSTASISKSNTHKARQVREILAKTEKARQARRRAAEAKMG